MLSCYQIIFDDFHLNFGFFYVLIRIFYLLIYFLIS